MKAAFTVFMTLLLGVATVNRALSYMRDEAESQVHSQPLGQLGFEDLLEWYQA